MLETVKLIADAVHPDHLGETFTFRSRSELLNLMRNILKSEASVPLSSNIRSLALSASASLVYPFLPLIFAMLLKFYFTEFYNSVLCAFQYTFQNL